MNAELEIAQDILTADVYVTSVSFTEDSIEVAFMETRDQTDSVAILRNMLIAVDADPAVKSTYLSLQETLRDLVDIGYFRLRNPEYGRGEDGDA